jgi:drug/metabolite transporter (DMT)-like permease
LLYLVGSIVLTSYLILAFKALERYKISPLQSIVFNYWVCVLEGSVVNGHFPINQDTLQQPWMVWAFMMGFLFISLFNLIGWMTQRIGVAVTSVAYKMSLVVPFLFSLYLYNEKATVLNLAGIIIALTAVLLTCWPARKEEMPSAKRLPPVLIFLMPALLFAGSGLLDTMIKYVEQNFLNDDNKNDYLITAFASAAGIGALLLTYLFLIKKQRFDPKAVLAGIAIGVPNYFSIWCLVKVLKAYGGKSAVIIPINNMGIVLFSSLMAYVLFKERLSWINWTGIVLALGAIALIAY